MTHGLSSKNSCHFVFVVHFIWSFNVIVNQYIRPISCQTGCIETSWWLNSIHCEFEITWTFFIFLGAFFCEQLIYVHYTISLQELTGGLCLGPFKHSCDIFTLSCNWDKSSLPHAFLSTVRCKLETERCTLSIYIIFGFSVLRSSATPGYVFSLIKCVWVCYTLPKLLNSAFM